MQHQCCEAWRKGAGRDMAASESWKMLSSDDVFQGRKESKHCDIFTYCHLRCLHLIFEGNIDISIAAFDMPLYKIK